ncbi:MAG: hypothetical protein ACP5JG_09280 [Anaerolineae bacterium]
MTKRRAVLSRGFLVLVVTCVLLLLTAWLSAYAAPLPPPSEGTAFDVVDGEPQVFTSAAHVIFPPGDWPWYAQGEISVTPELPRVDEPMRICATVINQDAAAAHPAQLVFDVAAFGIGVPFHPVGEAEVMVPPGGEASGCVVWIPPEPGHWCIQVRLFQPNFDPQISQRNIDIWEPLVPGEPHELVFPVGPFETEGYVSFLVNTMLPGWEVVLEPAEFQIGPREQRMVTLTTVPPDGPLGTGLPVADIEGFLNGEPIGGFRKLDNPPVLLHHRDAPFFAEREIHVWPYPPRAGEPTEICAEMQNLSGEVREVGLHFQVAGFGIGLPFEPVHEPIVVEVPPGGREMACIRWVPPRAGHFCVQVVMDILGPIAYEPQFSQRNLDVAEPLMPGVPHEITFPVGNFFNPFTNPNPQTTDIWFDIDRHLPDWEIDLQPPVLLNVATDEVKMVTMVVTPGELPHDGAPIVDVRALVDTPNGPRVIGGIRKVFRPPVPLHRFPDPPYAEREITIEPYPPRAGEPVEVCVDLYNPTDQEWDVAVQFSWADFGIGIPFTPINGLRPVYLPPHSTVRECIHWVPPVEGHLCLQVELEIPGYRTQFSQRNVDVDEPLAPGEPHGLEFPVGNPFDHPVTVTLGLIPHLPGWSFELSRDVIPNLEPETVEMVGLTVIPPFNEPLPDDNTPIVDVEAYVGDRLIGGFRKIFRPPVPIHRPGDPIYAESEIFIHPYPPRALEPTEVGAEIRNPTPVPQTVTVTFSAADFGIGLPFAPIHAPVVVTLAPHEVKPIVVHWIPPYGGLWCIQVEIEVPGHEEPFFSQRNIDVGEPLEPNTPHARTFPVRNPFGEPVTITLGLVPHFPDWGLELNPDVLPNMAPNEVRPVTLVVTPPDDLPGDGDPIVDVEAYARGELIGGFRKIFRPPVPVHRPHDPVYAESEIGVDPYPVIPGQPVELSVEVFNPTDTDEVVTATFSVAQFGIGLPFSTTHIMPNLIRIFVPARGAARGHVIWQPPDFKGKFCVQVTLELPGHDRVWSQRNIDVGEPLEPGQPHTLIFPVGAGEHTDPVTITFGLVEHREGWDMSLSQAELVGVTPGDPVEVSLTVTPSLGAELGTGEPIVDVEAFVDGELIGGFRKVDRPPVPLHKPHEKGYAESEIQINPYPPVRGETTHISTEIQNASDDPMTVLLEFGWAEFGMGIPFTTTGIVAPEQTVNLGAHMSATATVSWTPTLSGHQCVIVKLEDADGLYEPQRSQRNVDVEERPPCGQTNTYTFTVYNDSPFTATIDIGLITFNVPADWSVTVSPTPTLEIGPFGEGVVTVSVSIPCLMGRASVARQAVYDLQAQAGSVPTIDVEGYKDGALVGGIELQFASPQVAPPKRILLPIVFRH